MITEIILIAFAIVYYVFSVFLLATCMQNTTNHSFSYIIKLTIFTIIVAPLAVPIMLGIEIGEWIKNN